MKKTDERNPLYCHGKALRESTRKLPLPFFTTKEEQVISGTQVQKKKACTISSIKSLEILCDSCNVIWRDHGCPWISVNTNWLGCLSPKKLVNTSDFYFILFECSKAKPIKFGRLLFSKNYSTEGLSSLVWKT